MLFLIFFGPALSALFAITQFFKKDNTLSTYILALTVGGFSAAAFTTSCHATGIFDTSEYALLIKSIFIPLHIMAVFCVSNFILVLNKSTMIPPQKATKTTAGLFFMLSLLAIILLILPFFKNLNITAAALEFKTMTGNEFTGLSRYESIIYFLQVLPKILLIILMLSPLKNSYSLLKRKQEENKDAIFTALLYSIVVIFICTISLIGDFISQTLVQISMAASSCFLCFLFVLTKRYPHFLENSQIQINESQYNRSKLNNLNVTKIIDSLQNIMEKEKAFADEDLTLKSLSRELEINQHQLSEILNNVLEVNFNAYVNTYRIEEAKKMLIEEPGRSITSICNAVGFNSTTTFNSGFVKQTGQTPREFRKSKK
ncbi:MAG: AraC family transcriptional regulator [bacterium]|nr:AraC family transcriptional regulator [bacterium]